MTDGGKRTGLDYEALMKEAMRSVVRGALRVAAEEGLPGDHHFLVTFRSDHPGVLLPERVRQQYPEEISIVLQHQFWDLEVEEGGFTVGLSFGGVPTTVRVPFDALVGFADPSVGFGLQFMDSVSAQRDEPSKGAKPPAPRMPSRPPVALKESAADKLPASKPPAAKPPATKPAAKNGKAEGESPDSEPPGAAPQGGNIVAFDRFRKK